ncbi:hypothetical protein LG288_05315 [Idiomarina seosinensis]|uniref:hypothetical protein n=1 Tax=Idiomarina seosinensis TaxID=281739 RepID=UPI00384D4A1C
MRLTFALCHYSVLLGLLVAPVKIADAADITWGVNPSPPFHINTGSYQNQGFCDVLVSRLRDKLPNIKQNIRYLPAKRITYLMKKKDNLCFPCMIKKSAYNPGFLFTDTTHLYPAHGILTHREAAERIVRRYGNPVTFAKLAQDPEFRFAQSIDRRYGKLQALINRHLVDQNHYITVAGENAHVNLMNLLLKNRVDYTIDYEAIKRFYEKTHPLANNEQLVFLPIQERVGDSVEGAVGCTSNAWGQQATAQINKVISELTTDDSFQAALDFWLGQQRPRQINP